MAQIVSDYRVTVVYEFELEAPDYDSARQWALEEVEHGHVSASDVDVERVRVPVAKFTYPREAS